MKQADYSATVFVVDDDEAVRDSLAWLLEAKGHRVAAYPSAHAFLQDFKPEQRGCLVLDVRMPEMSGLELQETLLSMHSRLPIIFITGHGDVPMAVNTMKKGAVDFIEKPFNEQELLSLIEGMLNQAATEPATDQIAQNNLAKLTVREKEVLDLIVAGRLNKQIADDLDISIKTVEAHRAKIMEKLNARNFAELMRTVLAAR